MNTADGCRAFSKLCARCELASIGPPREHGGWVPSELAWTMIDELQLGRRVNTADGAARKLGAATGRARLQLGRRVNTADGSMDSDEEQERIEASIGPPREHGGWSMDVGRLWISPLASIGPPREHGGWPRGRPRQSRHGGASIGPPREHGGWSRMARIGDGDEKASIGPPREHGGWLHVV